MHELKAGLNADKFALFGRHRKVFTTHSFYEMTFMHSTTGLPQVDLRDFEKP